MSEIEKMYENAEVKKQIPKICSSNELYCKECKAHIENAIPYCKSAEYPPFTAEKQIELIKWLAETGDVCRIDATVKNKWFVENEIAYGKCFAKFEEALANVINIIWEYMPDEEKQQVKGILE